MSNQETNETSREPIPKELTLETKEELIKIHPKYGDEKDEIEEVQDTSLQQEKRRYISFLFCQISIGIISAYLYI